MVRECESGEERGRGEAEARPVIRQHQADAEAEGHQQPVERIDLHVDSL